jgi:FAD:protein FMN transferase
MISMPLGPPRGASLGTSPADGVAPGPTRGHAEPVMGTVVSFAVRPGPLTDSHVRSAIQAACAILHDADAMFSTWEPRSPLSRLRRGGAQAGEPPAALAEVEALCQAARAASGGWFDPWALPGGYDPTGLVKGWAVDLALSALRQAGLPAALVNGGGDLAGYGSAGSGRPWRAGIRHPWRAGALAAVVDVPAAVATSGSYERGPAAGRRPRPSPARPWPWPTRWPPPWPWAGTRRCPPSRGWAATRATSSGPTAARPGPAAWSSPPRRSPRGFAGRPAGPEWLRTAYGW